MVAPRDPGQLGAALVAALNSGDVPAVLELYDPAAVLELPDGTLAVGHEAIGRFADLDAARRHRDGRGGSSSA